MPDSGERHLIVHLALQEYKLCLRKSLLRVEYEEICLGAQFELSLVGGKGLSGKIERNFGGCKRKLGLLQLLGGDPHFAGNLLRGAALAVEVAGSGDESISKARLGGAIRNGKIERQCSTVAGIAKGKELAVGRTQSAGRNQLPTQQVILVTADPIALIEALQR